MVVLVVRHEEMPESSECRRNFLVCISEMEKRVPGARLWCSLSPDHAFLGLLLACQSDWRSSPRQHRMPGLSWLLASFSKEVIIFQLSFCCHFFGEKALGNVLHHSPIHHHFSAHCHPLPLGKQCPWSSSPGITVGSQSCLLPVVLERQHMAPGIRAGCAAPAAPAPSILCPSSPEESVRLKLPFLAEKLYQAPDHLWSRKITWWIFKDAEVLCLMAWPVFSTGN